MEHLQETIQRLAEPVLTEFGAQIVEIKFHYRGLTRVITVLADKIHGRISLDECSAINVFIRQAMGAGHIVPNDDFELEVSSPGLDRPLKTQKDFERAMMSEVHFYLSEVVEGKKEHIGKIVNVCEDKVLVEIKTGVIAIEYPMINKAVCVLEV
jgi:ribosome maturation factor RimP